MASKFPSFEDDGLIIPEVGPWGVQKYRLVENYATMFATSMKGKWGCRVYIDLFAGSGLSRIGKTSQIVPASPLIALNIRDRFDVYIFCEADAIKYQALKKRVSTSNPKVDTRFVQGDANNKVAEILQQIPQNRKGFKVLCFCFVDPYSLNNLAFETIRKLAARSMDFLILIPSGMDANRNVSYYVNPANKIVDQFLGTSQWRDDWKKTEVENKSFGHYVTEFLINR
jgi:three-Cys-motif partner protein